MAYDGNGNVMALISIARGIETARYDYDPFGQIIRATGPMALLNSLRFSTQFADDLARRVKYPYRDYGPNSGRWLSRDPLGEVGGNKIYAFIYNNPISLFDPLGLAAYSSTFVGKSFINSIPRVGSFGILKNILYPGADLRLLAFATLNALLPAFHQNPQTDAKDGLYRLYTRVTITADCCGTNSVPNVSFTTDTEGGKEGPVYGSINLTGPTLKQVGVTVEVNWEGWGHPNSVTEPAFHAVMTRKSINIWHNVTVVVSCQNGKADFQLGNVRVSKFPSFRIWRDSKIPTLQDISQGAFNDLWLSEPPRLEFVAP
jgi:RHS repeat-associated protein